MCNSCTRVDAGSGGLEAAEGVGQSEIEFGVCWATGVGICTLKAQGIEKIEPQQTLTMKLGVLETDMRTNRESQ